MSQLIESILVELRPKIQACNVYIITKKWIDNKKVLKLNLKPKCINLSYENNSEILTESIIINNCELRPSTITNLIIDSNYISFRVSTQPNNKTQGSFSSEILSIPLDNQYKSSLQKERDYFNVNKSYKISCNNCKNYLTEVINFTRILPLPSENCNPEDWFCHKDNVIKLEASMKPKFNDCFYGLYYFCISSDVLIRQSVIFQKVVYCKRCLAWLGNTSIKNDSVTFWDCTVNFQQVDEVSICNKNETNIISTSDSLNNQSNSNERKLKIESISSESNPLQDFKNSVLSIINDTVGIACKILLECIVSNSKTEYLLVWVITKNLNILTLDKKNEDTVGGCQETFEVNKTTEQANGINNVKTKDIILESMQAIKLLFRHESQYNPIVRQWQAEMMVQNLKIAKPMLEDGLLYLKQNAELLNSRSSDTDGYFVSYLLHA